MGLDDALSGTDDDSQLRLGLLAVCRAAGLNEGRTAKTAQHMTIEIQDCAFFLCRDR